MGGLEQGSGTNAIFLSILEAKSTLKSNTNTMPEKFEFKKTRINDLPMVYCGKDKHSP